MCAAVLASEHFYGASPPASFLTEYTPPMRRISRGYKTCLPVLKPVQLSLKNAPKSCLKVQTEKSKKKVAFADDRGFALEQVRVMTEPSHIPPFWTLKITSSPPVIRKSIPKPVVDLWEMRFQQPSSDYIEFRRKITDECVSLENVIVKSEGALDGTVKVKNIDYGKEVFVRSTADGWRSHEDHYCAFSESGPVGNDGVSIYDTFSFRVQLPVHSRRLDFCVCFKCKGSEFWDSNNGCNYVVEKSSARCERGVSSARVSSGNSWSSEINSHGKTPYW